MTPGERLAILVHELRSPVAALTALAEQAARVPPSATVLGRIVATAAAAGCDVERLLSDPDVLSVRPVETDVAELLRTLARPGVSCSAEPLTIVCDPTRLRQAIGNLVANGLRHGTEVSVDARRVADDVVVTVRDDGPGVDPALDPFPRGVSPAGSSGYGLWLARAIAEAHGGGLVLESSQDAGAAFRLSLPRGRPSSAAPG